MSEQVVESLSIISAWGVPDWQTASDYPDKNIARWLWRWEFLRRRDDYRQDWLKWAPETYENYKVDYEVNLVHQYIIGQKIKNGIDTGEDSIEETPKVLLPMADLNFGVKMPGSEEKYELALLPHPANPRPWFLSFGSGDLRGVMWEPGRGEGLSNYWGIEYTVLDHELTLRFDLTTKPVRELMASFTQRFSLSPESRQFLGMDKKTKGNIPNMFRQSDYAPFPSLTECPLSQRTHIQDPQHPGMVHVIWDCRLPYGQQQREITDLLALIQESLPNKPRARRVRRSAWANYLRVLDARAVNPETQKPYAKYEDIGYEVFNSRGYASAKAQAKTAHNDAVRLMNDFPL